MMRSLCRENGMEDGSITVFMTFIFLLLFTLTGAALDSARYFGSGGYVTTSAYGADVAVYGEYNRELFTEYGLFGYGGCNGKEVGTGWNVMKRFCQTICGSDRYHRKRAFFPGGMLPSTR